MRFRIALALVIFLPANASLCAAFYVPDPGEGVCVGNCDDGTGGGDSGSGSSGSYTPAQIYTPSGPSAKELKQQREEKDLEEAALDAGDSGVKAYQNGDYEGAVKYFSEALEYAPDDPDIQHNLDRAREALRESEAARQLKIVEQHSQTAASLVNEASSMEARRGFDTAGTNAGSLEVPVVNAEGGGNQEPAIPLAKRTWAITKMELQREMIKKNIHSLQEEQKKLDPVKDAVKIVEIRQKESDQENKIHFLNFSITEELRKSPDPKSDPVTSKQTSEGK